MIHPETKALRKTPHFSLAIPYEIAMLWASAFRDADDFLRSDLVLLRALDMNF